VPARYVGSLVVRGDDASYDDVFHRWNEIYLPGYGWVPVDANAGDKDLPADQGAAFGGISNRFLITTEGAGDSEYLGWSYNHENRWVFSGKSGVRIESIAEWEPLEDTGEETLMLKLRCGDD
jgi:transglutaminase-like putative cysteine protease